MYHIPIDFLLLVAYRRFERGRYEWYNTNYSGTGTHKPLVTGSIPVAATTNKNIYRDAGGLPHYFSGTSIHMKEYLEKVKHTSQQPDDKKDKSNNQCYVDYKTQTTEKDESKQP